MSKWTDFLNTIKKWFTSEEPEKKEKTGVKKTVKPVKPKVEKEPEVKPEKPVRVEEPEKIKEPKQTAPEVKKVEEPQTEVPTGAMDQQSPIDLCESTCEKKERCEISFSYERNVELTVQKGKHYVEFITKNTDNFITVKGLRYNLVQFHFHTPSEHSVDGSLLPAEIHLVHKSDDGRIAVVGILLDFFSFGDMTSGVYRTFAQNIVNQKEVGVDLDVTVDLTHVLPREAQFFWYDGSLTTPPYMQGVSWFVTKKYLPQDVLCELELAIGEKNNREVQPTGNRTICCLDKPMTLE